MATTRSIARSFGGGEVGPEFWSRFDDIKYQTGLADCRNFVVKPHGPVENRAGFAFVREVKDSTKKTRLIPFTFAPNQTVVLEFGAGYIRFHTEGATVLANDAPYEIASPYEELDLFSVHFVQSGDVVTLTHRRYAPRELRRTGATAWALTTISFAATLAPPATPAAVATPKATDPGTPSSISYVITALSTNGDESVASAVASCSNNLFDSGAYNSVSWAAVTGAERYYVYKFSNGLYGYIGQTETLGFVDDNIAPNLTRTPPKYDNPFASAGNYPRAVGYFEQRRFFGGTDNDPATIWATRSGTESNLSYSIPVRDDDRIKFRVAARERNTIRHIVPLTDLALLTEAAEWRVAPSGADVLTPISPQVRAQSFIGANDAQPVIVNANVIFAAARGGHVREMAYSFQAQGFLTGDLSLRAPHLFDGYQIVDTAYAKSPIPIVWFVSSNGNLLGLTYVPEQEVGAWHRHDTDGAFESACAVAEGDEDRLYVVVKRTIAGQTKRYIERMASRRITAQADAFFVDAGVTYDGAAATTISGLSHLEGKTVSVLADGAVHRQKQVINGAITLDQAASKIQIGLPITADIRLLPISFDAAGYGQGRVKNVNAVWLRVVQSGGIKAGPSYDKLTEAKTRTNEDYGSPTRLVTKEIKIAITPDWTDGGQACVRQSDPLPLTITSFTTEYSIGGG